MLKKKNRIISIYPKKRSKDLFFVKLDNGKTFEISNSILKSDVNEGFENTTMSNKEILLQDLQSSIDIQKACTALENQEKINLEETKLQQFKIYNLKLQKQKQEFERLNAIINKLREKREQQMKKTDMLNVAKYQGLRGQEIKLKDTINERLKDQNKFDINLNLIKK